jgi:hypothetical protein
VQDYKALAKRVLFFIIVNSFWRNIGGLKWVYNVTLIICVLLDIILLFTAAMGVGASGYDDKEKVCYFQR